MVDMIDMVPVETSQEGVSDTCVGRAPNLFLSLNRIPCQNSNLHGGADYKSFEPSVGVTRRTVCTAEMKKKKKKTRWLTD